MTEYAAALGVDIAFLLEALNTKQDDMLILSTVDHFRRLQVEIAGDAEPVVLSESTAVLCANYATGWSRPLSVRNGDGCTPPRLRRLCVPTFKRAFVTFLHESQRVTGALHRLIHQALENPGNGPADAIYDELVDLGLIPQFHLNGQTIIFEVAGFAFGGGFYVTRCFVLQTAPSHDGINVIKTYTFGNHFQTSRFSRRGAILFETRHPNDRLW